MFSISLVVPLSAIVTNTSDSFPLFEDGSSLLILVWLCLFLLTRQLLRSLSRPTEAPPVAVLQKK